MGAGKTVFWVFIVIIGIVGIIWAIGNMMEAQDMNNEAQKELTASEQNMYDKGRAIGMSDAEIQADIDRIEGK